MKLTGMLLQAAQGLASAFKRLVQIAKCIGCYLESCTQVQLQERAGRTIGVKRKGPKGPTRSRLAKRLLGSHSANAALSELSQVEGEVWRERESNKW